MIQPQNFNELEIAPSGHKYLHQNMLIMNPHIRTNATVTLDIHRVISPLNPVATA